MEKEQKILIFRIVISSILFILSFFSFLTFYAKLFICIAAYLIIGYESIWNAIKNIIKGEIFDENFLMLIATIGAFAIKEFSEAVAVMLFYEIGEFLQDLAVDNSKKSITKMMDIRPEYANLLVDNKTQKVKPENVNIDDIIVIEPGEKIPLDGIVIEGKSSLNTMALTGESLPKEIEENDIVSSGCINLNGLIKVKVTKKYEDSTVSQILNLIENTESNKAKTEKFITKFAKYYTPAVVGIALVLAVLPPLVFGGNWTTWLSRALTFLVISCPCALVVSIPLSFFAGIGGASKKGILIKGASFLEQLSKIDAIAFDKTGTLTKGNFKVSSIHPNNISEEELLEICALAENSSTHPIAQSILKEYSKEIDYERIKEVENLAGFGIKAKIDNKQVYVGNEKLMKEIGINVPKCEEIGTIIHVVSENNYIGYIEILDEMKSQSKEAMKNLKQLNLKKLIMLTGDKTSVAEKINKELELDEFYSELSPIDKVQIVKKLQAKYKHVGFVGDGINDAPVLNIADVGIAMGGLGSDVAIESADIVLMDDNPEKIAKSIKIARKTMKIAKENIIFALSIKLLMLLFGATGIIGMWLAVFADVGVALLAILNSLRALKTKNI